MLPQLHAVDEEVFQQMVHHGRKPIDDRQCSRSAGDKAPLLHLPQVH